jgi:hypothetical protein
VIRGVSPEEIEEMVMSSNQVKRDELVGHIHKRGLIYRKPCSCCGSEKHGALEVVEKISSTQTKVRFSCPMVRKKYPIIWKRNLKDLILWPTAKRFAEYHSYREEVVKRALIPFRMYGGGRWMSNIRFLNFRDEVTQLCKKPRRSSELPEDQVSET